MRNSFVNAAVSAILPLLFSQAAVPASVPAGDGIGLVVSLGSDT